MVLFMHRRKSIDEFNLDGVEKDHSLRAQLPKVRQVMRVCPFQ